MLQKCARVMLATVLSLSLCPCLAFADEGESSGGLFQDLLYTMVGFSSGDEVENIRTQASSLPLYSNGLQAPPPSSELPEMAAADGLLSGGILVGMGNYLYYLREATFTTADGATVGAYRSFERYSLANGSWETLESLPDYMEYVSAVAFGSNDTTDGQIVLLGTPMDMVDGVPTHAANPEAHIYTYNPDEDNSWLDEASTFDVPVAGALVNNGGILQIVGGIRNGTPSTTVTAYELMDGVASTVGELNSPVVGAQVVPHSGALYIYSYASDLTELQEGTGHPRLSYYSDDSGSTMDGAFPAFVEPQDMQVYPSQQSVMSGALTSADKGPVFVGPNAQEGGADTLILDWAGSSFNPYSQVLSNNVVSGVAATVYGGNLYAIGSIIDSVDSTPGDGDASTGTDSNDPSTSDEAGDGVTLAEDETQAGDDGVIVDEGDGTDQDSSAMAGTKYTSHLVFRSTPMVDASIVSGNNGIWRKGSTTDLDFVFSPDYGRFKHVVAVDGEDIVVSQDYDSAPGSTAISLKPEFLEELKVGDHTLTAYFDNRVTDLTALFSIEEPGSVVPDPNEPTNSGGTSGTKGGTKGGTGGYTSPVELAPTADTLPVVPIAVLAVVATLLACLAFRRSSSY